MQTVISLLVALVTSFRAVAELVSQKSRVFSGESVRLKCSVPDDVNQSSWSFSWFKGSELLPQTGKDLILWKVKVQDSGTFYCQGEKSSMIGNIHTLQSLPVEISVDGGWAILQVSPHPSLVGNTLRVACRVRGEPELHEVILYKDGLEVMRQRGPNPTFDLSNLTLKDEGMYSCRASWDSHRRTVSVISAEAPVHVLEALSQPALEIDTDSILIPEGPQTTPSFTRDSRPFPSMSSSPDSSLPVTAQSTHQQPTSASPQSSNPQPNPLPPTPRSQSTTVQPITQTSVSRPLNMYMEYGEMSEESGDMPEGSGDVSEGFGDMSEGSGDMFEGSGDMFEGSGDLPEGSGIIR
ncbi:Fc receptor-like protein 5 isoform X2 [Xyrichtys novacula]|uniref:Fc receptor-like protein 5 isoform X2 n=1 Tax=Xyrichtys novacula TaxID=13765 RepID=A0AAV1FUV6_XYRNO|nr:Fc receptor-like protein 5 isoform X2 [Xyrichtys novacula]